MSGRRRHWLGWLGGGVGALVIALVALAWWFPARWAWQWVHAQYPLVQVTQVSGTVWDGQAQGLRVRGQPLGTLHWSLGRAVVWGDLSLQVDLRGAGVMVNGHIARDAAGAIVVDQARFDVPMARLKVLWPTGTRLDGQIRGQIVRATWVQGWPTHLDADVRWQAATVDFAGHALALGNLLSHWHTRGGTVVMAALHDDGAGPVALRGTFVMTVLGWRLDATVTPRRDVPGLTAWLRHLGKPAADGSVHIERAGGLMAGRTW